MASQYDQLRVSFDRMNAAQKKQFIDKLKAMPNRTPEHMQFVNECVQKYNGAGVVSARVATRNDYDDLMDDVDTTSAPIPTKGDKKSNGVGKKIRIGVLGMLALVLVVGIVMVVMGNTLKEKIIGIWISQSTSTISSKSDYFEDSKLIFTSGYNFRKDGTYKYIWSSSSALGGVKGSDSKWYDSDTVESGKYYVFGKTIYMRNEETGRISWIKVSSVTINEILSSGGSVYKRSN